MTDDRKPIDIDPRALDAIRSMPPGARQGIGFQLDLVQMGLEPDDFKPVKTVGAGVYEIRVRDQGQAFRSFYVARFPEAVYVLHAFEKKSQKTAPKDLALGQARYKEMIERRKRL